VDGEDPVVAVVVREAVGDVPEDAVASGGAEVVFDRLRHEERSVVFDGDVDRVAVDGLLALRSGRGPRSEHDGHDSRDGQEPRDDTGGPSHQAGGSTIA